MTDLSSLIERVEGKDTQWLRDGADWRPTKLWQAVYAAIEEHATQPEHLYTPTERELRLQAMALADRIEAALLRALHAKGEG